MFHRTVSAMMLAIDSKLDSDKEFWFYISMLVGNSVRGHLGSLGEVRQGHLVIGSPDLQRLVKNQASILILYCKRPKYISLNAVVPQMVPQIFAIQNPFHHIISSIFGAYLTLSVTYRIKPRMAKLGSRHTLVNLSFSSESLYSTSSDSQIMNI